LTDERYYGSSVLTPDGDLWVLGGTHASKTADSTEVLEYKPRPATGRFRKGFPLPTELRDTGKCKRKQTILRYSRFYFDTFKSCSQSLVISAKVYP
jgi:hypothetical protein